MVPVLNYLLSIYTEIRAKCPVYVHLGIARLESNPGVAVTNY